MSIHVLELVVLVLCVKWLIMWQFVTVHHTTLAMHLSRVLKKKCNENHQLIHVNRHRVGQTVVVWYPKVDMPFALAYPDIEEVLQSANRNVQQVMSVHKIVLVSILNVLIHALAHAE